VSDFITSSRPTGPTTHFSPKKLEGRFKGIQFNGFIIRELNAKLLFDRNDQIQVK
jgi:hypothetical protein